MASYPTHEITTPAALWVIESLKEEVVEGHESAKKLANFARHLNGRAVYWQTIALKLLHSVATNEEIVEWLMEHPKQETGDADDTETNPVVREGT